MINFVYKITAVVNRFNSHWMHVGCMARENMHRNSRHHVQPFVQFWSDLNWALMTFVTRDYVWFCESQLSAQQIHNDISLRWENQIDHSNTQSLAPTMRIFPSAFVRSNVRRYRRYRIVVTLTKPIDFDVTHMYFYFGFVRMEIQVNDFSEFALDMSTFACIRETNNSIWLFDCLSNGICLLAVYCLTDTVVC